MKKMLLIGVCLFLVFFGFGNLRTQKIDSLMNLLNNTSIPKEKIDYYYDICLLYSDSDIDSLVFYAEKGLALADKEKNKSSASNFMEYLGTAYYYQGDNEKALTYLEKSLQLAIESKNKRSEASSYKSLAVFYSTLEKYDTAIEYYTKALPIYDAEGLKRNATGAYIHIAGMHMAMGNHNRAVPLLEDAIKIAEELDDPNLYMAAYYNLGDMYGIKREFDKALEYLLKAWEISLKIGNIRYQSAIAQSLSNIYMRTGDIENAEIYAKESLKMAEQFSDPFDIAGVLLTLSNICRVKGDYEECERLALKVWEVDSTHTEMGMNTTYNIATSNIYLGNKEKAIRFLKKYSVFNEQFVDESFHQKVVDMEIKYETEKKEAQIVLLEKEKELYIWLGIAGMAILFLALGLLFIRHRLNIQKHKLVEQQVKQLEQEKQLIATQAVLEGEAAERSRLARDLHDGLGGMLSVVKLNLKDMKGYTILDGQDVGRFDKALELLDQSIGELRRVAHHMMPESLIRYGLKVSLEDFCHAIPGASFQYLGEDLRLDSQLEVLIYRCAYELVNNAVKHSQATEIKLQLMIDNGVISFTVYDNGIGFNPEHVTLGAGLGNIRNRVSSYNGKMNIYSSLGKGTEVSIEIESA